MAIQMYLAIKTGPWGRRMASRQIIQRVLNPPIRHPAGRLTLENPLQAQKPKYLLILVCAPMTCVTNQLRKWLAT